MYFSTASKGCEVKQYNYSGFGSYGGILMRFYTAPNCGGSLAATLYACTTGSTDAVCSASVYNTFSEPQLQSIYTNLIGHARSGNAVNYLTTTSCKGGGTNCLESVYFKGN